MPASSLVPRLVQPAPREAGSLPYKRTHHYPELDALRGIAALVVVLDHYSRLWDPGSLTPRVRTLLEQVLRPVFNGSASVVLFFLLSGFVLSLPYKRGSSLPFSTFLLRRLARIYLPYLGALGLALLGDFYLHQPIAVSHWFSETWTAPLSWPLILQHVLLIGNYDTAQINTAFWSLAVEMRLSIVFPFFCIPFLRWRSRFAWTLFGIFFVLYFAFLRTLPHRMEPFSFSNLSEMANGTLCFAAGILLARWLEPAKTFWTACSSLQRILFCLVAFGLFEWSGDLGQFHLWAVIGLLTMAGGCGLLLAALSSRHISLVLNHRIPAYLGQISYSLYLVHGTILFALVHLFWGRLTRLQLLVPYLALAFIAAAVFFAICERPCTHLSRSIGRGQRTEAKAV
jgi:peptidoglycan/LPS O-acetylase OafA/YrhL